MSDKERESLIEEAATAWRGRDPRDGRAKPHPAWADLDAAGRVEAWEVARVMRTLESAVDAEGLSATGRAVLRKIRGR
jgi:hypothetical protein